MVCRSSSRFDPSSAESVAGKFAERSNGSINGRSASAGSNSSQKFHDFEFISEKTIEISSDDFGAQLTERLARSSLERSNSIKSQGQEVTKPETQKEERPNSRSKVRHVNSKVDCSSPQSASPAKPQSKLSSIFTDRRSSGSLFTRSVIACPEDRAIPYRDNTPGTVSSRAKQTSPSAKRSVSAGKVVQLVDTTKRRSMGGTCRNGEIITVTAKSLRKSWEGAAAKDGKDRCHPKQVKSDVKATLWSSVSTSLKVWIIIFSLLFMGIFEGNLPFYLLQ